jgi:PKD repeat protein
VINCSVLPNANFILSDTGICGGSCINFVDLSTNANSWQWYFPGATPSTSSLEHPTNICYAGQGQYDVTLIAGNTTGFDTIIHTNLIQVTAGPPAVFMSQSGDTLLASTSSGQLQWYFNNISISGATGQSYVALVSGLYSVSVTDANGCSASSSPMNVFTSGISEAENEMLFHVYPNPFSDELYILLHGRSSQKLTITLFDALGRILMFDTSQTNSSETTLKYNFKNIAAGIYFLEIRANEKKWLRTIFHE